MGPICPPAGETSPSVWRRAGDLAATLVAGSTSGYTLVWAAVVGCIVWIARAEATGRWHLATERTIFLVGRYEVFEKLIAVSAGSCSAPS